MADEKKLQSYQLLGKVIHEQGEQGVETAADFIERDAAIAWAWDFVRTLDARYANTTRYRLCIRLDWLEDTQSLARLAHPVIEFLAKAQEPLWKRSF